MENKENKKPLLAFALQFDTKDAAGEFRRLYEEKVVPAKAKRSGAIVVKLQGTRVSILEGIE